ncbi:hypothetical protein Tco_1475971 [Tanacetum coccineum]
MELVLEQPEVESTNMLAPTPLRSVPGGTMEPPGPDATSVGSSEDADVAEVDSGLKRKRATNDDGAGPSKRVRPVSLGAPTPHNIALPFTPFFLASLMAWASKDSFNGISFSIANGFKMSRGQAKIGTCTVQSEAALTISSPPSQQQAPHMHYHYIQVPVRQALSATSVHAVPPLLPPYHVPMHTSPHPQRTA